MMFDQKPYTHREQQSFDISNENDWELAQVTYVVTEFDRISCTRCQPNENGNMHKIIANHNRQA